MPNVVPCLLFSSSLLGATLKVPSLHTSPFDASGAGVNSASCVPRTSPSAEGLAVPVYEKRRQGHARRREPSAQPRQTPFSRFEPPSSQQNVVCVSAHSPQQTFACVSHSRRTPVPQDLNIIPYSRTHVRTNPSHAHNPAHETSQPRRHFSGGDGTTTNFAARLAWLDASSARSRRKTVTSPRQFRRARRYSRPTSGNGADLPRPDALFPLFAHNWR